MAKQKYLLNSSIFPTSLVYVFDDCTPSKIWRKKNKHNQISICWQFSMYFVEFLFEPHFRPQQINWQPLALCNNINNIFHSFLAQCNVTRAYIKIFSISLTFCNEPLAAFDELQSIFHLPSRYYINDNAVDHAIC